MRYTDSHIEAQKAEISNLRAQYNEAVNAAKNANSFEANRYHQNRADRIVGKITQVEQDLFAYHLAAITK